MPAPSLSTPAARIELRDLATSIWHDLSEIGETDGPSCNRTAEGRARLVASEISDLGFLVAVDVREGASSPATITVTACDGSSVTLDWEPSVYGFDYPTSGDDGCDLDEIEANTEDEPDQFDAAEPPANSAAWCDGCEQFCPIDDVEISAEGDETFAYCKGCRAKDANAPRDCY